MKKIYYLTILAVAIIFSACNQHNYAPALYKNDMAYQFKPMSTDEQKSASYLSLGLNESFGANGSDQTTMGQLNFDHANTFENLNIAYGAYGFFGAYQNSLTNQSSNPGNFDTKSFEGYGLRGSINAYAHSGNVDYRLIGLAAAFSQEYGAYSDFRKYAQSLNGYYSDASQTLFTAGFTNEIAWQLRNKDIQLGYRVFLGGVFGDHRYVNTNDKDSYNSIYDFNNRFTVSASYFMQIHRYTMVAEFQNFDALSIRVGFVFNHSV